MAISRTILDPSSMVLEFFQSTEISNIKSDQNVVRSSLMLCIPWNLTIKFNRNESVGNGNCLQLSDCNIEITFQINFFWKSHIFFVLKFK